MSALLTRVRKIDDAVKAAQEAVQEAINLMAHSTDRAGVVAQLTLATEHASTAAARAIGLRNAVEAGYGTFGPVEEPAKVDPEQLCDKCGRPLGQHQFWQACSSSEDHDDGA